MNKIRLVSMAILLGCATFSYSQESKESIMEKRARAMIRAIDADDPEIWKEYIRENYSQALIDRPMKSAVQSDSQSSEVDSDTNNLEAKAKMFGRLHNDFAGSKITSVKTKDNKVDLVLLNDSGLKGIFHLTFETASPYLISGLGIEAEN